MNYEDFVGIHSQRPPDFLTKNKRAVKNMKSRAPEKKPFKPPLSNRPHPPQRSVVNDLASKGSL